VTGAPLGSSAPATSPRLPTPGTCQSAGLQDAPTQRLQGADQVNLWITLGCTPAGARGKAALKEGRQEGGAHAVWPARRQGGAAEAANTSPREHRGSQDEKRGEERGAQIEGKVKGQSGFRGSGVGEKRRAARGGLAAASQPGRGPAARHDGLEHALPRGALLCRVERRALGHVQQRAVHVAVAPGVAVGWGVGGGAAGGRREGGGGQRPTVCGLPPSPRALQAGLGLGLLALQPGPPEGLTAPARC
jgi:hypothetical protein